MVAYDFRIRFNFPESSRINSDLDKFDLLNLDTGERFRLSSGISGEPIKNHSQASIIGGSFNSESEAKIAAEKTKQVLLYWSIYQRTGIDFGDVIPRSAMTREGIDYLQKIYNYPIRNDLHGIDVYEHTDNLKFVSVNMNAVRGMYTQNLIDIFKVEYFNVHKFSDKLFLASEIYASSFFDITPRSRFITLVTSIEALAEPQYRSDNVKILLKDFETRVKQSEIEQATKNSIIGQLTRLNYQSIGEAARNLIRRLIPEEIFAGKSSVQFFTESYAIRSELLHQGKVDKSVDILSIANEMELFVNHLLIAALNSQ